VQDIGPLSLARAPVALTVPLVQHQREAALQQHLRRTLEEESAAGEEGGQEEGGQQQQQHLSLVQLQRQLRAKFVTENYDAASAEVFAGACAGRAQGAASLLAGLVPLNTYFRRKRQNKRESKTLEKSWKEKQGVRDGVKRRNNMAFSKAALGHRDEFLRFHKSKRSECAKLGRAVRAQLESVETKKEKQEGKAEARRLQALKENDMESYMQLVQETKNSRLKHLLDQTDDYISTINRMVQAQRMEEGQGEGGEEGGGGGAEEQKVGAVCVSCVSVHCVYRSVIILCMHLLFLQSRRRKRKRRTRRAGRPPLLLLGAGARR
jgi:hypothetical protein